MSKQSILEPFPKNQTNFYHSLKSLLISQQQKMSFQKQYDEQLEIMLAERLQHSKTNKLRNVFVEKLKRLVSLKNPKQVKIQNDKSWLCGISFNAIHYSQRTTHAILISNVIIVLVLIFLATFQSTLSDFVQNVNYQALLIIKISCLCGSVICFIFKCTSRSFRSKQHFIFVHRIVEAYFFSGRLIFDIIVIGLLIATIVLPKSMTISGILFVILVIVFFFTVSDLIKIQAVYLKSQKNVMIWGMLKVCFSNILVAHVVATILLAMALLNTQENWMTKININNQIWQIKYYYALYWGTTTMMTVGFGDITPNNDKQVLITTFVELFSCIVLAYNISYIGSMISKIKQKDDLINKKLIIFDRMVKCQQNDQENVSGRLQRKIKNYIEQYNYGENALQFQMKKQLLAELPEHLRMAYYQQANKRIFSKVPFFKALKQSTIQLIAAEFQSKFYFAGENLFEANFKIMILQIGVVGYTYKKKGSSMNDIIFDQISIKKQKFTQLLTPWFLSLYRTKNHGYITKVFSVAWIVQIENLLDSLKTSAIDYQHYFSILHKHTIDQSQWNTIQCARCSNQQTKYYHISFDCPRLVYSPIKQTIILRYLSVSRSKSQIRNNLFFRKRNIHTRMSALLRKQKIQIFLQKNKKRLVDYIFQEQDQLQRYYSFKKQSKILQKFNNSDNIITLNEQKLLELIQRAIKKFETDYQDDFWYLQTDIAYNYNFYFPSQNPNRLIQKPIFQIFQRNINVTNFIANKTMTSKASLLQIEKVQNIDQ